MALRSSFQRDSAPQPDDPLPAIVLRYQELYHAWSVEAYVERRSALRDALRTCQEELWSLLAEPLLHVAHGWLRSGVARDMWACPTSYPNREDVLRSLAMNMYLHVIDALPQLRVDPTKNLLACLKTIATRGMFDEHLRIYSDGACQSDRAANQPTTPGSRATHMWPTRGRSNTHLRDQEISDLADPQSMDFEEQLAVLFDQRACCQAVWAFWETLTADDQRIVMLRWNRQPPIPFEMIAQQLGPEWTAATIRQRHCRVMTRTRAHLQELGLIDGDDEVVHGQ